MKQELVSIASKRADLYQKPLVHGVVLCNLCVVCVQDFSSLLVWWTVQAASMLIFCLMQD